MSDSGEDPGKITRRNVVGLAAVTTAGAALVASQMRPSPDASSPTPTSQDSPGPDGTQDAAVPPIDPDSILEAATATVAENGFDITVGSVRVHAAAGVAAVGVPVAVTTTRHPGHADDFTTPVGDYVHILLGDGDQPATPITIVFDLCQTDIAASVSAETPLVAFSTMEGVDTPLLMEGSFDPQSGLFTVVMDHLSGVGAWLADLNEAFLQFMWELMGLTFTEPACAYNSTAVGNTTYSVPDIGNDHLWPCISNTDDEIQLELHSNSVVCWQITSTPGAAYEQDSDFLSPNPALARIYQAGYAAFGEDRYVLMPGSAAVLRYKPDNPPEHIAMELAPGLQIFVSLFHIVHKAVETFLKFIGGEMMPSVLEHFACFIDLVRSLNKLTDEGHWVGLITAGLSCLKARLEAAMPRMVEELMEKGLVKFGGKFAARAILASLIALISLLIGAASALTGVILGALYTIVDRDDFSFAIAASGSSSSSTSGAPASTGGGSFPMPAGNTAYTHEMPGPAPRLDRPIVVRWTFETIETYRTQPMIVADGGVFFNVWEHDHSTWAELLRLDAATGNEVWRVRLEGEPTSPVISDDLLFIGRWSESSQFLVALDAQSGERQWEMTEPFAGWAAHGGNLYVAGENFLRSIDPHSREQHWESPTSTPGGIAIADNILVLTDGYYGNQQAFDIRSGRSLWTGSVSARLRGLAMANGLVLVTDSGGRLFALNAQTGETQWTWESGFGTSAFIETVTSGAAYVTSGGLIHKINLATGALEWKFTGYDTIWPVIVIDDIAYAGDVSGMIYTIDATNGEQQWSMHVGEVAKETPTVVNGIAYCEYGGTVYAVGNLPESVLRRATTLRGAPSATAVKRGEAAAGSRIEHVGSRRGEWVEVTINGTSGWIPLDDIDPATLPPDGEIEFLYEP